MSSESSLVQGNLCDIVRWFLVLWWNLVLSLYHDMNLWNFVANERKEMKRERLVHKSICCFVQFCDAIVIALLYFDKGQVLIASHLYVNVIMVAATSPMIGKHVGGQLLGAVG